MHIAAAPDRATGREGGWRAQIKARRPSTHDSLRARRGPLLAATAGIVVGGFAVFAMPTLRHIASGQAGPVAIGGVGVIAVAILSNVLARAERMPIRPLHILIALMLVVGGWFLLVQNTEAGPSYLVRPNCPNARLLKIGPPSPKHPALPYCDQNPDYGLGHSS